VVSTTGPSIVVCAVFVDAVVSGRGVSASCEDVIASVVSVNDDVITNDII
jgi:hypothetical protein